jgi:hypothetical protein
MNKLLLSLLGAFAEYECSLLRERALPRPKTKFTRDVPRKMICGTGGPDRGRGY